MGRRRHTLNADEPFIAAVTDVEAAALFGECSRSSVFLHPPESLVKGLLAAEISASCLTSCVVAGVAALLVSSYWMPWLPSPGSSSTHQLPPWRMPFPVFTPCPPANSTDANLSPRAIRVCVTTAFTPGPSDLLEFPIPPKMSLLLRAFLVGGPVVAVIGFSIVSAWWSVRIVTFPGAIAASVLAPALSTFPVWFARAVRENVFRFILTGYGPSFTNSTSIDEPHASQREQTAAEENLDVQTAPLLSDTERHALSADVGGETPKAAEPSWAWLNETLLITVHPALLLLRVCRQCVPSTFRGIEQMDVDPSQQSPSLFHRIPRTAADTLQTITNQWCFQFVLTTTALASRRKRSESLIPALCAVAFIATILTVYTGLLNSEASFESDALERWARAVEEIPRRIFVTAPLRSHAQLLNEFSSWYPTGLNHRDRAAPFVTITSAAFGACAAVIVFAIGLMTRGSTWQVLVAKHVAAIHDVAMFSTFLSLTAAFASIASVTPTLDTTAGIFVDAKLHQGFSDVAKLSRLWEYAKTNTTQPFDTVSFAQLHPTVPNSGIPRSTAPLPFAPVFAASREDLESLMVNTALFTKQPWAMTWPSAIVLVASIAPACIGFVATVGRGCVETIQKNRKDSLIVFIVIMAVRAAIALTILPACFVGAAVALFGPCLSLFLHFGSLEASASLLANALLHGLCDEADRKRERHPGSIVSDGDTAAVSVFKTLCAATLPPPPLSVNECPKASDLAEVKNGWSRRLPVRLALDQSSDDESASLSNAGAPIFDDDVDAIPMQTMRGDNTNTDADSRRKADPSLASSSHRSLPPPAAAATAATATPSQLSRSKRADIFTGAPIWSRTQKQRRALVTEAKVRIRARFEELDVAYFNRPTSRRTFTTLKDFFEDEKLEGDFALFWIMYRELAPERVIDAVAEEIAAARAPSHRGHAACDKLSRERPATPRRRKCDSKNEKGGGTLRFSSGTAPPPASVIASAHVEPRWRSDDDDEDDEDDDFDDFEHVGIDDPFDPLDDHPTSASVDVSPAERTHRAAADDLDSLPASIHAANLFQHFDEASRREFEMYCQRKCEYTVRSHHRSSMSDGSVADAMMLHTDAVLDVERAVQRDPSLWTSAHHLAEAASANLFPIVRDPDREIRPSVFAVVGAERPRRQYFQLPLSPFHAVPRTVGGEAGQREEPIPWFSEGGFVWGGRLPFFGLARAVGSAAELARVLPKRLPWFLLHAPLIWYFDDFVSFVWIKPFAIATIIGRLIVLIVTLIDVPLVLLTCRKTTSVWRVNYIASHHATNFTQIGGVTDHSFECVPTLTLVMYGVRILCLLLLAVLYPAVARHLRRGFLWSIAPRLQDDQKTKPPWSLSSDAPKSDVSIFRAGSRVHTENAAALGYMMARPESIEMELAVRCLVDMTTPKPVIELLRHVPHRVVPRALAVRIVGPFLPAGSLV